MGYTRCAVRCLTVGHPEAMEAALSIFPLINSYADRFVEGAHKALYLPICLWPLRCDFLVADVETAKIPLKILPLERWSIVCFNITGKS